MAYKITYLLIYISPRSEILPLVAKVLAMSDHNVLELGSLKVTYGRRDRCV